MRSHLVEWVEKASFDHLNKVFEITTNKRNHQIFLTDWNLLVVVREPKLYVLPILPHPVLKVLVSSKHHVLKDFLQGRACMGCKGMPRSARLEREKVSGRDVNASSKWEPYNFQLHYLSSSQEEKICYSTHSKGASPATRFSFASTSL